MNDTAGKISQSDADRQWFYRLRRLVGWIGLALPVILMVFGFMIEGQVRNSISAYYHSNLREVFTGILIAIGCFLIAYKGYPSDSWLSDKILSRTAGAMSILVAILPFKECVVTKATFDIREDVVFDASEILNKNCSFIQYWLENMFSKGAGPVGSTFSLTTWLHYGAAILFFLCLACFCIHNFRKGADSYKDQIELKDKRRRNRIYMFCGLVILGMVGILLYYFISGKTADFGFFLSEAIAVWAFAIAWLVKGRADEMRLLRPVGKILGLENLHRAS